MSALYLLALVLSMAAIGMLDWRYRLSLFKAPKATLVVVAIGTLFFLAWDLAGIANGVFIMGESPYMTGVVLAPELPLEEVFFLVFLSYLTLVVYTLIVRMQRRGSGA